MGWGQTLKNDPTCNFAPRVVTTYKLHWYGVGQILTLKNETICCLAQRVVMKYKLHFGWGGVKFKR